MIYKLYVHDRNYKSWEIFDANKFIKIEDIHIDPISSKLLSNDVFTIDKNNKVNIMHSTIRLGTAIPGVLILTDNKTYGRYSKSNNDHPQVNNKNQNKVKTKTDGKLLYKCIPDDMRLPIFLVPYEIKSMGFSKVFKNLYVTIKFDNWDNKHPIAKLDNIIGPIDVLDNFYEYQLYCKSLNASIQKFNKDTTKALNSKTHDGIIEIIKTKYTNIEDRSDSKLWHIITIDPPKSLDYDDGFGIVDLEDGIQQLSIYISNVTIWMDVLNLWDSFSHRISTIYLPDKKRPMLPTILSDCLCSLQENVTRIAFAIDVFIKDGNILNIKYTNCIIKVYKNYCYEEAKLLSNSKYHDILNAVCKLSIKKSYIDKIRNSHDVVCYLMILMNYQCAKELIKCKSGIFRSTIIKKEIELPSHIPENTAKFIKIWNGAFGQYIDGSEIIDTRHELLDMDAYIHITSPIRRLVDLLNMINFQKVMGLIHLSENSDTFYNKWLKDLEYINITMRAIRKVQCDCTLLDLCYNTPEIMEKEYDGYLFDKISRNDGLYQFIVFLPELKLSSRITCRENLENFDCRKFKMFLFNNEEKFKKKIRLQLL
jgi:exoribonuclease R